MGITTGGRGDGFGFTGDIDISRRLQISLFSHSAWVILGQLGWYLYRWAYIAGCVRLTYYPVGQSPRTDTATVQSPHRRARVAGLKTGGRVSRRSLAENAMYRFKQLFGDRLASRQFETQVTEVHVRVAALNIMTYLGLSVSVSVGVTLS
jgi:hypothetical protein